MKDFVVKERSCDVSFQSYGPYWHVYTSGKETPLIFNTREDFAFAMNVVAQAYASSEINILAFEIMSNHFHFVLSADEMQIHQFWSLICKKMMKSFPVIKDVKLSLKPIDNLQSLRNNIIYTNRNGYVADRHTLHSAIHGAPDATISMISQWSIVSLMSILVNDGLCFVDVTRTSLDNGNSLTDTSAHCRSVQ